MPNDIGDPWSSYDDQPDEPPASFSLPPVDPVQEGIVPLGHDKGVFYYLSRGARQVVGLTAGAHSENTLKGLASATHYWERTRFVGDKGGVKWGEATDWLMSECRVVGIFDPSRLRGRGAWIDNGRAVLHTGDRLIVDGVSHPLMLPGSTYVYEAALPLSATIAAPLSSKDAFALVGICQRLRWERGISGTLLAGFCAIAPICGGLAWRPSIWITGSSGSGKSWLVENVLTPALSGIALHVTSKTSEAGIRQALGSDARPVLFDEAEREDAGAATRMQAVLDLVRQSASEGGAEIIKGSQSQSGAKRYRIRSCFAFSSINVGIEHQADESRITVLSLRTPKTTTDNDATAFQALVQDTMATITPQFAAGLVARSVRLLPTIRANAETFAQAVALHLGSRRMGDQLGALLAGAYSLHSDKLITPEAATKYVIAQEWNAAADETERDEIRLLTTLTQSRVKVAPGNGSALEITIGRLVVAAWGMDERISADVAEGELRTNGLRTDGNNGIFVSTNHPALKKLLAGTPWSAGWSRALARLPGADGSIQKAIRFGALHVSKAVWIPRVTLEGGNGE